MLKKILVAIDTETTGLDVWDPRVQTTNVAWYDHKGRSAVFPVSDEIQLIGARHTCSNTIVTKLMFNAKFDIRMLAKIGVLCRGSVIDVLLMAQLLLAEEKNKNLKHLSRKFLSDPYLEEARLKSWLAENKIKVNGRWKKRPYSDVPSFILDPYNLKDAKSTIELFAYLSGGMDKHNLWTVLEREMLLMRKVVLPMEATGIRIDQHEVDRLKIVTTKEMQKLKDELVALTGDPKFNPNSAAQVAEHLYKGALKPQRFSKKTGAPSVDAIALLEQPSPLGTAVSKWRKISKARSTYLDNFDKEFLRVSFNQGGTRTGRFSSSGPNLQNIPRPDESSLLGQMRRCFVARPGRRLIFIDYEQVELRLTAHFSQETHMLQAINNGEDLHGVTCKMMFDIDENHKEWKKKRYLAKTLNFAVIYGTGAATFRETVLKATDGEVWLDLMDAAIYISTYKEKHPGIEKLFSDVATEVANTGGVMNHYGRFLVVSQGKSYTGVNYKIQSTAADLMKMKMLYVADILKGKKTKLLVTVHDELIFDLHPDEKYLVKKLKKAMEELNEFSVPLTCSVSIGKNWHDKKELHIA